MQVRIPDGRDPVLRLTRQVARAVKAWHRASLEDHEHLPRAGGALSVGNHGLLGFESLAFFHLLHEATGRFAVGLADRFVFGWHPMKGLLARVGGVPGTPENALALLREGHLVVCYPGGAREVFKDRQDHYRLCWERSHGFAKLAIRAGVPVVPFAALGVDDAWVNLGAPEWRRRLLGRYAVPTVFGLGPLPLPVRFQFRFGPALHPPANEDHAPAFKQHVQSSVEGLLAARTDRGRDAPHLSVARVP